MATSWAWGWEQALPLTKETAGIVAARPLRKQETAPHSPDGEAEARRHPCPRPPRELGTEHVRTQPQPCPAALSPRLRLSVGSALGEAGPAHSPCRQSKQPAAAQPASLALTPGLRNSCSVGMNFPRVCPRPHLRLPLPAAVCAPAWGSGHPAEERQQSSGQKPGAVKLSRMPGRGRGAGGQKQLRSLVHREPGDSSVLPCAPWDFWGTTPADLGLWQPQVECLLP